MTHNGRNLIGSHSASFDARSVVRFVFLGVALLPLSAALRAADGRSSSLRAPAAPVNGAENLDVAIHVRAALRKDPLLGRLNLGIRMTNGIAYVSGPVPSNELLQRAKQVVAQIPGVLEVRTSGVYIESVRRDSQPLTLPLADKRPTQSSSASPNPLAGALGTLTGRDPSAPPPPKKSPPVRPSTANASASSPRAVTLLAPEAVVAPPCPASSSSISSALDRLRQRDARFRKIRTEVRGTTVVILAGDTSDERVMAFAQAVARLTGVQRVVVRSSSSADR